MKEIKKAIEQMMNYGMSRAKAEELVNKILKAFSEGGAKGNGKPGSKS